MRILDGPPITRQAFPDGLDRVLKSHLDQAWMREHSHDIGAQRPQLQGVPGPQDRWVRPVFRWCAKIARAEYDGHEASDALRRPRISSSQPPLHRRARPLAA